MSSRSTLSLLFLLEEAGLLACSQESRVSFRRLDTSNLSPGVVNGAAIVFSLGGKGGFSMELFRGSHSSESIDTAAQHSPIRYGYMQGEEVSVTFD